MRMKKKFILSIAFLFAALNLLANVNDIVVEQKNGAKSSYPIDEVARIELGNSELTVIQKNADGVTYAFDEVKKIYFTSEGGSAIETVHADPKMSVWIASDGSTLKVNGWDCHKRASVSIYSLQGVRVMALSGWDGAAIDISSLEPGIYVIQLNGMAAKFRK